jgi:hypothetical protein
MRLPLHLHDGLWMVCHAEQRVLECTKRRWGMRLDVHMISGCNARWMLRITVASSNPDQTLSTVFPWRPKEQGLWPEALRPFLRHKS